MSKKSPPPTPDLFPAGTGATRPSDAPKLPASTEQTTPPPSTTSDAEASKPPSDATAPAQTDEAPKPEAPKPAQQPPRPTQAPVPFDPKDTSEMFRYAWFLAGSDLVPKALRGKQNDILIVLLKGRDLGLKPLQSISNINVIDGKAEVGALLMVSLVLKSGLCDLWRLVHSDTKRAVYETKRRGQEITPFEYTIEEAEQMGLLDKGRTDWARENNQWKKQPRTMLRRRCQSMLAREVYPDVVIGLYDHDEIREALEAERIGLTPKDVATAIEVNSAPVIATTAATALPQGKATGDFERIAVQAAPAAEVAPARAQPDPVVAPASEAAPAQVAPKSSDPLKARIAERAAQTVERRCTGCGDVLDERDKDPCWACRDAETNPPDTITP